VEELLKSKGELVKRFTNDEDGTLELTSDDVTTTSADDVT